MSALVITTEVAYACPNCDGAMVADMTMRHGVTQKQVDGAMSFDAVKRYSTRVLERCLSCDYTREAEE